MAALGLSGCTTPGPPPATPGSSVTAATVPAHPLPDPVALTDVVAQMSDPAVPGTEKLGLIDGSSAADASAMDGFAKALADNHLLPLTVTATDLAWSESTTGVVTAMREATPDAADLEHRAGIYLATWPVQHDLWETGGHPWLSGSVPVTEPRL